MLFPAEKSKKSSKLLIDKKFRNLRSETPRLQDAYGTERFGSSRIVKSYKKNLPPGCSQ